MRRTILKDTLKEHYSNLLIYAIVTAESDLRLCMLLNQVLGINLALYPECEVRTKKGIIYFRRYAVESDEGIEKINLYNNKNAGNFLIPELKKIDFILVIQTETNTTPVETALQKLKSFPEISVLTSIDPSSLKSLSRIISY